MQKCANILDLQTGYKSRLFFPRTDSEFSVFKKYRKSPTLKISGYLFSILNQLKQRKPSDIQFRV